MPIRDFNGEAQKLFCCLAATAHLVVVERQRRLWDCLQCHLEGPTYVFFSGAAAKCQFGISMAQKFVCCLAATAHLGFSVMSFGRPCLCVL